MKAKVKSPDGDTDYFNIHAGVMQGDTLAPYLFVVVLDDAMRKATEGKEEDLGLTIKRRQSKRVSGISITDLDHADDIALLSNDIEQARTLLRNVETECGKVGLKLNSTKTKAMFYNVLPQKIETIEGKNIKQAFVGDSGEQDFNYLGSWIESKDRDISVRKAMAWKALNKLGNIWKSNLSKERRLQLFTSTVESVLMYGSSTWALTSTDEKRLDQTYTRMLRKLYNVTWRNKISNKELYGKSEKLSSKIRRQRLQLAGHVYRDQESPVHHLVTWIPRHGKRSRGRPTETYVDTLLRDTGLNNTNELEACMKNRYAWRLFSPAVTTKVVTTK